MLWMGKKEISGLLCNETLFLLFVDVFRGLSFLHLRPRAHTVHAVKNKMNKTHIHACVYTCADLALQSERKLCFVSLETKAMESLNSEYFRVYLYYKYPRNLGLLLLDSCTISHS